MPHIKPRQTSMRVGDLGSRQNEQRPCTESFSNFFKATSTGIWLKGQSNNLLSCPGSLHIYVRCWEPLLTAPP